MQMGGHFVEHIRSLHRGEPAFPWLDSFILYFIPTLACLSVASSIVPLGFSRVFSKFKSVYRERKTSSVNERTFVEILTACPSTYDA